MADWELHDGAEQVGPLDEERVIRMLKQGAPASTMVRRVGETDWRSPRSHAPFAIAIEQRAAATTAAPSPAPVQAPKQASGEDVILQLEAVTVTRQRAMVGGTTYAIANITSVRLGYEPRQLLPLLLGILLLVVAAVGFTALDCGAPAVVALFAGLAAIGIYFLQSKKYWVIIVTAAHEARAIWYKDALPAKRIVDAINEAIVRRG